MNLFDIAPVLMTNTPNQPGQPQGHTGQAQPQQSQQPGQPHQGQAQQPGPQQPGQPAGPHQQPPGNQSVTASGKSKSGGCVKWGCGCGCITLIIILILGGIGAGVAFWKAPEAVGADSWGETIEFLDSAQKVAGSASSASGDPSTASQPATQQEQQEAVRGLDEFFSTLDDTTISKRDISNVQRQLEDWEDSKSVRDFYSVYERVQALEDEEQSILDVLRSFRLVTQLAFRANDLGREYHEDIGPTLREDHSQLVAITRVSQMGAGNHEPWDQEVADALLEDHDKHREEYEEARRLFQQAMEDDDFNADDLTEQEQAELAEVFSNQVLLINSAINRGSLETWAGLSDEEREALIDQIDAPHAWVGRIAAATVHGIEDEPHMVYIRMMGF